MHFYFKRSVTSISKQKTSFMTSNPFPFSLAFQFHFGINQILDTVGSTAILFGVNEFGHEISILMTPIRTKVNKTDMRFNLIDTKRIQRDILHKRIQSSFVCERVALRCFSTSKIEKCFHFI